MATTALRPILLALTVTAGVFFVACDDDDDDGNGVIRQQTTQSNPDTPGNESLANDVPELVREHLRTDFSDRDWYDDVEAIDHDGDTVRVTLDEDLDDDDYRDQDVRDFTELCTAVAGQLLTQDSLGVRTVVILDEHGDEVMRAEGEPQCSQVAN